MEDGKMAFHSYSGLDWHSFSRKWYRKRNTKNAPNHVPYLEPLPPEPGDYSDYSEYLKSRPFRRIARMNANRIVGWCCEHAEIEYPSWLEDVPFDGLKQLESLAKYFCVELPSMETFLLAREGHMKSLREEWFAERGSNGKVLADQIQIKGLIEALSATYKAIEELFADSSYKPQYAAALRILTGVLGREIVAYLQKTEGLEWGAESYSDFLEGKNPNFVYPTVVTRFSPLSSSR